MHHETQHDPEPLKGLVAGAVAGLAGAYAMNLFQTKVLPRVKDAMGNGEQENGGGGGGEPATVKAAKAIVEDRLGMQLTEAQEKKAGPIAHYAMGGISGAIYGVSAEYAPIVRMAEGAGFGAVVWGVADETIVPLTGLSKPPTEYPMSTHIDALASHLVYGWTTEVVRRGLRAAM